MITCEEMRRLEEAAFARGVGAGDLMEQAGRGIAEIVRGFHSRPGLCVAFCGKGNNAGDALVALRHLKNWGWKIAVRTAFDPSAFSELSGRHFAAIQNALCGREEAFSPGPLVVLDGLLGLGARGEPRGEIAEAIRALNGLRREKGAWVLAVDLPSGLDGDSGVPSENCVEADLTAAIACAKEGLVADAASNHVGRLAVVPLPELQAAPSAWRVSAPEELRGWLPPRHFDSHKGKFGRVGVIAGSSDFSGAARMCSAAVVRGGAGLVTLYARPEIQPLLAMACIPEVMVKAVGSYREVLNENLDVLAIGPGLGQAEATDVLSVIRDASQPMVVDADGLNALSRDVTLLRRCQGPRLLTPHPGEMERLFACGGRLRREWLEDFLGKFPVTLLLKGARTVIGAPAGPRYYNSTGHPGMGSGGMGDVLTGVCAALIPQVQADGENRLLRSAVLGAWVCGRAAEIGVFQAGESAESLCASTVLSNLGSAFRDLREGRF